jgi:nitroreductase
MELQETFKKRRSIRHYTKQPVPREHVEELVRAAQYAPVSCNLQLTKYIVIDNPETISLLQKKVSYKFSYSPCYIIVVHDTRFTINRYSGIMSAGMAVDHMLLKAVDLGLATCAMAGFSRDHILRDILKIPKEFEILLIVSIGYEDTSFKPITIPKIDRGDVYAYSSFKDLHTINASPRLEDHSIKDVINYRRRISPVYLDRFRLNTFDQKTYQAAHELFQEHVGLHLQESDPILDVMSYDGTWIKLLHEIEPTRTLIASDYLKENLEFFHTSLHTEQILITSSNTFEKIRSIPCATMIFQAEFTPQIETLLQHVAQSLEGQGIFFVTVYVDKWYARSIKWFKKMINKFLYQKTYNIYEHSPYYKIGAHVYRSESEMKSLLRQAGFSKITTYKKSIAGRPHIYILGFVAEK